MPNRQGEIAWIFWILEENFASRRQKNLFAEASILSPED